MPENLESELTRLLRRAHERARAEKLFFKEVIIPARIAEIEREITAEMQAFAPGASFRFGEDADDAG